MSYRLLLSVLTAWPGFTLAPLLWNPRFRRSFPQLAQRFRPLWALFAGLWFLIASLLPLSWLEGLTAFSLLVSAAQWWRSHPWYGRASRLPPGSLALFPVAPWTEPDYYQKQFERFGPIFKMSSFHRPTICLVGFERAFSLLSQQDADLDCPALPFSRRIPNGYLRFMDSALHGRSKQCLKSALSPAVIAHYFPQMRTMTAALLHELAQSEPGDLEAPLDELVQQMWLLLFLGVDKASPTGQRLRQLYRVSDLRNLERATSRQVDQAIEELYQHFERMTCGPMPVCFLKSLAEAHPEKSQDRSLLGNLIYLLAISAGDVGGLLHWTVKMLATHPQWLERVATCLRSGQPAEALAWSDRIAMETLRLHQSEHLFRVARKELSIGPYRIPKGWMVRVCVQESHRLPESFPNPTCFDPDRFASGPLPRDRYCPFGAFRLACLGTLLTRQAVQALVLELANYRLRLLSDGPHELSLRRHWRPGSAFRVELQRT